MLLLQEMCGYEYVSKLQRMHKDKFLSADISDEFRREVERSARPLHAEFSVMVISTNSWPFNSMKPFTLPRELHDLQQRFTQFYTNKHSGRRLNYLYQMCKGELTLNGFDKRYTLVVSCHSFADPSR